MSWEGRRAVVTGAGGFLGRRLVPALVERGAAVVALGRPEVDLAGDPDGLLERIEAARPDVVFHLVGHSNLDRSAAAADACMRSNVQTTIHLLRALERRPATLVLASTLDVYGIGEVPFREDQRERPTSPYGTSKLAAEHLVLIAHRTRDIPCVVLRLSTVFGPGQFPPKLIPAVIDAMLRGERLAVGAPDQRRNLLFVDDALQGLMKAAERPEALGEVINIAGGREYAVREIVDSIRHLVGGGVDPEWGRIPPRPGETPSWLADCSKADRLLGWRQTRQLEDGLAETVRWRRAFARDAEPREEAR